MDLCEAIIDHHLNGSETEAITLRSLVPAGRLILDYDHTGGPAPYIIVTAKTTDTISQGTSNSYRIDEIVLGFEIYVSLDQGRADCVAIGEALENCYLRKVLETDSVTVLRRAQVVDPLLISHLDDYWLGTLNLSFLVQKSPQ